ncbi:EamA family transporter RarD [Sneathiella aquimaris]|uniref:EamA family transporter RarD n=1 Tax=Sneathiella aquimaris TaxID=2599305 RepID=UPI00146AED03|nr:EamA family transporter RarD [Sneathiella aquimaris]
MSKQSSENMDIAVSSADKRRTTHGLLAAFGAFFSWGIFPLYFKSFGDVPALEIMAHRIVWSLVFVGLIVLVGKRISQLKEAVTNKKTLMVFAATTLLIGINWLTFVWAISVDRLLEASLGYYINPLVSVVLGMLFLKERLNRWQIVAVAFATCAVIWLTVQAGALPWVSLVLAFSFGFYGLLRKMLTTESAVGLAVETALLAPISAAYIVYLMMSGTVMGGDGNTHSYDLPNFLLFFGTGIVTAMPLILFSMGAQRLRLGTVGLMQYIAPSMHVVLAVLVFKEPVSDAQIGAFIFIWIGLIIYSWDGIRNRKKT